MNASPSISEIIHRVCELYWLSRYYTNEGVVSETESSNFYESNIKTIQTAFDLVQDYFDSKKKVPPAEIIKAQAFFRVLEAAFKHEGTIALEILDRVSTAVNYGEIKKLIADMEKLDYYRHP